MLAVVVTVRSAAQSRHTLFAGFTIAIGTAKACTRGPQGSEAQHTPFDLASPLAVVHVSRSSERSYQTTRRGSGANLPGISIGRPKFRG